MKKLKKRLNLNIISKDKGFVLLNKSGDNCTICVSKAVEGIDNAGRMKYYSDYDLEVLKITLPISQLQQLISETDIYSEALCTIEYGAENINPMTLEHRMVVPPEYGSIEILPTYYLRSFKESSKKYILSHLRKEYPDVSLDAFYTLLKQSRVGDKPKLPNLREYSVVYLMELGCDIEVTASV